MGYSISVVTPAYNAEKYIQDMIKSVIKQPLEIELIIVNDGSTDRTKEICQQYTAEYKNIKMIDSVNMGAGHARNLGISQATGEYIIFLDSDDLLVEGAIKEELERYLKQCLCQQVDIIYTVKAKTDMECMQEPVRSYPEPLEEIRHNIPRLEFWTCIYRRKFLQEKDVRFFEYRRQDIETAFRYRAFSRSKNTIVNSQISFYLQRDNLESNTHTFNYYQLYAIKAMVYYELLQEQGISAQCKDTYFLSREVLYNTLLFYNYVKENGWESDATEEYIDKLWENFDIVRGLAKSGETIKKKMKLYQLVFNIQFCVRRIDKYKIETRSMKKK